MQIGDRYFVASANTLHEYVFDTDAWEARADVPASSVIMGMGSPTYGAIITDDNDTFTYDPGADSWAAAQPFPDQVYTTAFPFSVGGQAYLVVAHDTGVLFQGTYVFDGSAWGQVGRLEACSPERPLGVFVLDDVAYTVATNGDMCALTAASKAWMPVIRSEEACEDALRWGHPALLPFPGRVYVLGGFDADDVLVDSVWMINHDP